MYAHIYAFKYQLRSARSRVKLSSKVSASCLVFVAVDLPVEQPNNLHVHINRWPDLESGRSGLLFTCTFVSILPTILLATQARARRSEFQISLQV